MENDQDVCRKYNIVMDKVELFKQRSCEYYFPFNFILPYPDMRGASLSSNC